jgi:hypothetical protein
MPPLQHNKHGIQYQFHLIQPYNNVGMSIVRSCKPPTVQTSHARHNTRKLYITLRMVKISGPGCSHSVICSPTRAIPVNRLWRHILLFFIIVSGMRLSPLGTAATTGVLYQPQMIDDGDCGETGGMKIGRGNRSTRRKAAPAPLGL